MKIVLIGPAYPLRGGNALFVAYLYEALRAGNDVEVISFSRLYPGFLFPGVRQHDVSTVAIKQHPARHVIDCLNPLTWFKAAAMAAEEKPDILVITWWNPFFGPIVRTIARSFKRRTGKPVLIITENVISHEGRFVDKLLTKLALGTADAFMALSSVVEDTVKKMYPQTPVVRSSLPIYDCYQSADRLTREEAQKKLGIEGKDVLLFFGYVRQYKGLMNLLSAMPAVLKRIPKAHLLVVGEFYDDPAPYDEAIRRFALKDHVTVVNEYVPNERVHEFFTASHVVVLPYNEATQSGILSIALGFAKPAIVTNVGGLAELIEDGKTGYVVPPNEVPALANAAVRFFELNDRETFSKNVEAKARENGFAQIRATIEQAARTSH
jgi:glycosyltransferase involved in cell wall biosynthesis